MLIIIINWLAPVSLELKKDHVMNYSGRFEDQMIIVTGAGSGIGRATTLRLLSEGAHVVGCDISAQRLGELEDEVSAERLQVVSGDIADAETISDILRAAGPVVTGLANVAGIMDAFLPPSEVDDVTWDRVFRVNVTAPMRLTRAVLPLMVRSGKGAIVNVASEASLRASASGAAYTASKHAIAGLTKSVAFFHGPQGIRANAVAPGAVATNIEAPMKSEYAASRIGPIMQALVPPAASADDLASAIVWLLSDDSTNINGAILPSDGGWSTI